MDNKLAVSKQMEYKDENVPILKRIFDQEIKRPFYRKRTNKIKEVNAVHNETSFSFLLQQQPHETKVSERSKINRSVQATRQSISNSNQNTMHSRKVQDDFLESNLLDSIVANDVPSLLDFKPIFASTPKHSKRNDLMTNLTISKTIKKSYQKINKRKENNMHYSKKENSRKYVKQRSISSRFFEAINESCTTFVKTVTNIFKTKKNNNKVMEQESTICTTQKSDSLDKLNSSCSYSFTNYMRKRDALLSSNIPTDKTGNSDERNTKFCKTCNDTGSLKRKVDDNNYLKETVTKLKLGINLYGCDFRVIF